jgi:hypothetical protein
VFMNLRHPGALGHRIPLVFDSRISLG